MSSSWRNLVYGEGSRYKDGAKMTRQARTVGSPAFSGSNWKQEEKNRKAEEKRRKKAEKQRRRS